MSVQETLRFVLRFFAPAPSEALERRIDEKIDLMGLRDKPKGPSKASAPVNASGSALRTPRSINLSY
jgi:ABC-type multidrug transport system ATPase subunit